MKNNQHSRLRRSFNRWLTKQFIQYCSVVNQHLVEDPHLCLYLLHLRLRLHSNSSWCFHCLTLSVLLDWGTDSMDNSRQRVTFERMYFVRGSDSDAMHIVYFASYLLCSIAHRHNLKSCELYNFEFRIRFSMKCLKIDGIDDCWANNLPILNCSNWSIRVLGIFRIISIIVCIVQRFSAKRKEKKQFLLEFLLKGITNCVFYVKWLWCSYLYATGFSYGMPFTLFVIICSKVLSDTVDGNE